MPSFVAKSIAAAVAGLGLVVPCAAVRADPPIPPGRLASLTNIFLPDPKGGPDFVATFKVKRGWGPPGDDDEIVTRARDWVRLDNREIGRASTDYVALDHLTHVGLGRDATGRYASLQIDGPGRQVAPGIDYDSVRTGAVETALGETCEIWDVYRQPKDRFNTGFRHLSCVTADGVELWRRTTSKFGVMSSAVATGITRRPVSRAEVAPPADLLDLKVWGLDEGPASPANGPDYEVTLASEGMSTPRPATLRRHGLWRYEDLPHLNGSRMVFSRRLDGAWSLSVTTDPAGQPAMLMLQHRPSQEGSAVEPVAIGRPPETVLGEPCAWVNTTPGVTDYGRDECRTRDGVPLRIVITQRGSGYGFIATQVRRGPLKLAQVLPAPNLLDGGLWGLPR
jgi:hypothetical protein